MTLTNFIPGEILYAANLNEAFANTVNIAGDNVYGNLVVANLTSNGSVTTDKLYSNSATISGLTIVSGNSTIQYANVSNLVANSGNVTLDSVSTNQLLANNGNVTLQYANISNLVANSGNVTLTSASISNLTANNGNLTVQYANVNNLTVNNGNVTLSTTSTSKLTANSGNVTLQYANVSNLVANNGNVTLTTASITDLSTNTGNVNLYRANIDNISANNGNVTLSSATIGGDKYQILDDRVTIFYSHAVLDSSNNIIDLYQRDGTKVYSILRVNSHAIINNISTNTGNVTLYTAAINNLSTNTGNVRFFTIHTSTVNANVLSANTLTASNANIANLYAIPLNIGGQIEYSLLNDRLSLFFPHAVLDSSNNILELTSSDGTKYFSEVSISNLETTNGNLILTSVDTGSIMVANQISIESQTDARYAFFPYATIDASNNYIDVIDDNGKRLFGEVTINNLTSISGNISAQTINVSNTIIETLDPRLELFVHSAIVDSSNNILEYISSSDVKILNRLRVIDITSDDGEMTLSTVNLGNNTIQSLDDRLSLFYPHVTLDSSNNVIDLYLNNGTKKYHTLNVEVFNSNVITANTLVTNSLAFGNVSIDTFTANSVTLLQSPSANSHATTKLYVDNAVASVNVAANYLYLEPGRNFGAVGDGVTDDSAAVNNCIFAAIAANNRFISIDGNYYVPTLNRYVGDVITIGNGTLTGHSSVVRKEVIPVDAPPPRLPWTTLRAKKHCPQGVANVASNNTVTIVLTGDSVATPTVSGLSPFATFNAKLKEAFIRDNPGVTINWFNRAIGGENWEGLDGIATTTTTVYWYLNPAEQWLKYIQDLSPDIVIVSCARNGGGVFEFSHMRSVLAKMALWAKVPDVIMTNSVGETQTDTTAANPENTRDGYEFAAEGIRAYALSMGHGLIDTETMESQIRFGYAQEYLPLLRNGDMIGGLISGNYNVNLPWESQIEVYGWGGPFRIDPGDWTTLGNEITFKVGAAKHAGANGCNFMLKREVGNNEIYYRVTSTLTSQGAAEDFIYVNWTSTQVTCNNTQYFAFRLGQQGSRLYFGLSTPGTDPAEPLTIANLWNAPFHGFIPRCGGYYKPAITCAAGVANNALTWLTTSDGIVSVQAALPHPRTLNMPQMIDREFASPPYASLGGAYLPWVGGGPHPGSLAAESIIDQTIAVNDFSLS